MNLVLLHHNKDYKRRQSNAAGNNDHAPMDAKGTFMCIGGIIMAVSKDSKLSIIIVVVML